MAQKLNTEIFIERAKQMHGDKYDYSKVDYVNYNTKVCIICPEHGEFWQTPQTHLRGSKCPKCANKSSSLKQRKTQEQFLSEIKTLYGDKYDYSKVEYISDQTKVCIICHEKDEFGEEHGEFWVTPNNFLRGRKCPKCSKRVKLTNEIFLKKAELVHGYKYDYSKIDIHGVDTKVTIICPEHGEFQQTPYKHMLGQGCPECAKKQRGLSHRITQEEFIRRAKETHGDYYDYGKVNYQGIDTKVEIICPIHGSFWQTPYSHTKQKSGCPKCNHSKLEEDIIKLLEENKINYKYCIRTIPFLNGLELDFYIPELNIGIECQGEQHFKPVDFNGQGLDIATNNYWKQIERDKIKKELCDKNGINLLYYSNLGIEYPYKVYENVNEILKIIKNEGLE